MGLLRFWVHLPDMLDALLCYNSILGLIIINGLKYINNNLMYCKVKNFESSLDDVRVQRYRRATSGFYFTLEHLAKALLLSVGVGVESHGAVTKMIGLHYSIRNSRIA